MSAWAGPPSRWTREISAIQHAARSSASVEPWPFVEAGQRVRLSTGPLQGLEGILVEANEERRVVVGLTVLRRSVAVKIELDWMEPMARSAVSTASSSALKFDPA